MTPEADALAALRTALSVVLHETLDPDCTGKPGYDVTQEMAERVLAMPRIRGAYLNDCPVCMSEIPQRVLDRLVTAIERADAVESRLALLTHVAQDIERDAGTARWPVNLDRLRMALDEMGALPEETS